MKFQEEKYEDYIANETFHLVLKKIKLPPLLSTFGNLILYGPSGVGKYTQALRFVKPYSPHDLKYMKNIRLHNQEYNFKISDVHYEVDMDLLGCNSKTLWNDIYYQIVDIISCKYDMKYGIIVCKNFHLIHNELLDIFYSYMQMSNVKFILLTESVSFIPDNIAKRCKVIPVQRPSRETYSRCLGIPEDQIPPNIINVKEIMMNIKPNVKKDHICNMILQKIKDYKSFKFIEMRDDIYSVFNFDVGIEHCMWYILTDLIAGWTPTQLQQILDKTASTLCLYSNNYRPIYHLEDWIYYVIKTTYGLQTSP